MSVVATRVTVGTTETLLNVTGDLDYQAGASIAVYNRGAGSIFVGGTGVTTGTGYEVLSGSERAFDLNSGEKLFGIAGSPYLCHILQTGV